jgi:hypothetical protein
MSRPVALIAVFAFFVVTSLTACGSSDSNGSSTTDNAAATTTKTTAPAAATTSQSTTDAATVVTKCHEVFDPFLAQIHKIEQIVDGTPRFVTYRAATNKLLADYTAFEVKTIPSTSCLNAVSIPTTNAYLTHLAAMKTWTECRKRDTCAKAMPMIEQQWRDARKFADKAGKGFEAVTAN